MKALITNAVMTLLDDQIVNAAEKGVIDEVYGLIPSGYLFLQDGVISSLGPMSALQERYVHEHGHEPSGCHHRREWQVINACLD